jgi:hypothetical protein
MEAERRQVTVPFADVGFMVRSGFEYRLRDDVFVAAHETRGGHFLAIGKCLTWGRQSAPKRTLITSP